MKCDTCKNAKCEQGDNLNGGYITPYCARDWWIGDDGSERGVDPWCDCEDYEDKGAR